MMSRDTETEREKRKRDIDANKLSRDEKVRCEL